MSDTKSKPYVKVLVTGLGVVIFPKQCTKCRRVKLARDFHINRRRKDGLSAWCKKCNNASSRARNKLAIRQKWVREYKVRNVEKIRTYDLRHRLNQYGLTIEQYEAMVTRQGGLCAICKEPETKTDGRYQKVRLLSVDHDHVTNKPRGLLCDRCNNAIGRGKDDPNLLRAMATYLESYSV